MGDLILCYLHVFGTSVYLVEDKKRVTPIYYPLLSTVLPKQYILYNNLMLLCSRGFNLVGPTFTITTTTIRVHSETNRIQQRNRLSRGYTHLPCVSYVLWRPSVKALTLRENVENPRELSLLSVHASQVPQGS